MKTIILLSGWGLEAQVYSLSQALLGVTDWDKCERKRLWTVWKV